MVGRLEVENFLDPYSFPLIQWQRQGSLFGPVWVHELASSARLAMDIFHVCLRASVEKVEITKCGIAWILDFCETSTTFDFVTEQKLKKMHIYHDKTAQKF